MFWQSVIEILEKEEGMGQRQDTGREFSKLMKEINLQIENI